MNRPIDAAAAQQRTVGRVHERIDIFLGNVTDLNAHPALQKTYRLHGTSRATLSLGTSANSLNVASLLQHETNDISSKYTGNYPTISDFVSTFRHFP
jgi:hypothetical protein